MNKPENLMHDLAIELRRLRNGEASSETTIDVLVRTKLWFNYEQDILKLGGPIQSEEEALELLKQRRAELVERTVDAAIEYGKHYGDLTLLEVVKSMHSTAEFDDQEWAYSMRWLGAVTHNARFRQHFTAGTNMRQVGWKERNIHRAPRRVWFFKY